MSSDPFRAKGLTGAQRARDGCADHFSRAIPLPRAHGHPAAHPLPRARHLLGCPGSRDHRLSIHPLAMDIVDPRCFAPRESGGGAQVSRGHGGADGQGCCAAPEAEGAPGDGEDDEGSGLACAGLGAQYLLCLAGLYRTVRFPVDTADRPSSLASTSSLGIRRDITTLLPSTARQHRQREPGLTSSRPSSAGSHSC